MATNRFAAGAVLARTACGASRPQASSHKSRRSSQSTPPMAHPAIGTVNGIDAVERGGGLTMARSS